MRQRLLFEGELSDVDIENVFPTLISKVIETGNDVFLRWNGVIISVESKDTPETLMQKYDEQITLIGLTNKTDMAVDGRDKHLYRITTKLGQFYVLSRTFDKAASLLRHRLDEADYGFANHRVVSNIEVLATERIYPSGKQFFCDEQGNLITEE